MSDIISTTLEQLGGRKFLAMIGARIVSEAGATLRLRLPRASKGVDVVTIEYTPDDTYRMTFALGDKIVSVFQEVYNDFLQKIFTEQTGLYTTL